MSAKIILIAGATASGKSSLAVKMAAALNGAIINADSMQIYKDLSLLSARPKGQEYAGIDHHLYGFLGAGQSYSVAQWHDAACQKIEGILREGKTPILVGGTGLYFKALLKGLNEIPEIDPEIRANVRALLGEKGAPFLHEILSHEDPQMATKLNPADGQRIARALEVIRSTGLSLAHWHANPKAGCLQKYEDGDALFKMVVERPRAITYERINSRLVEMVGEGALDEVRLLKNMNLAPDSLVLKALGVASFMAYLEGEKTLDAAISEAQTLTRRYAKRQMTWLRNQFPNWQKVSPDDLKNLSGQALLGAIGL